MVQYKIKNLHFFKQTKIKQPTTINKTHKKGGLTHQTLPDVTSTPQFDITMILLISFFVNQFT